MGPKRNLGDVHGHVLAVGVEVGLPGVGVDDQASIGARGPEAVVVVGAVGRMVVPQGGNHHAPDAGLTGQGLDLLDGLVDVVDHRHERHARPPHRVGGAELLQPAVVGPSAAEGLASIGDLPGGQAGAEGRGLLAGNGVAVGEDDLAGHAVGVQHGITDLGVVGTLQAPLVLALPLLDELAI